MEESLVSIRIPGCDLIDVLKKFDGATKWLNTRNATLLNLGWFEGIFANLAAGNWHLLGHKPAI